MTAFSAPAKRLRRRAPWLDAVRREAELVVQSARENTLFVSVAIFLVGAQLDELARKQRGAG